MSERVVLAAKIDVELRKRFDQFCLDHDLTIGSALERLLTQAFFTPPSLVTDQATEQVADQVETARPDPALALIKVLQEKLLRLEGRVDGLMTIQVAPVIDAYPAPSTMGHLAPEQIADFERRLRSLEKFDLDEMYGELKSGILGLQEWLRGSDEQVAQAKRRVDKLEAWVKREEALIAEDEVLRAQDDAQKRNLSPEPQVLAAPVAVPTLVETPQPEIEVPVYEPITPATAASAGDVMLKRVEEPKGKSRKDQSPQLTAIHAPQPRHEPYDVNGKGGSAHAALGHMRVTWTHKSLKNRMRVRGDAGEFTLIDNRDGRWALKPDDAEPVVELDAKAMAKALTERDMQPVWN